MATGKRSGCFKYGCFGCLAVGGVGLAVVGLLAVLAVLANTREKKFERVELSQAVDVPRLDSIRPAEGEQGSRLRLPGDVEPPKKGKIVLDVSMCRFDVEPGPPGEPIRVEGRYDTESFKLDQEYEELEDGGWVYRLKFRPRSWNPLFVQKDGSENRLRLILPRDAPFDLEGEVGPGESRIELGGLWVVRVDLGVGIGAHEVSFDDPLAAPMELLRLNASIGELRLLRAGNASPASIEVDHRIGEVFLDLRGEWIDDARVSARCGIGACRVRLPRDVGIELDNTGVMIGESNVSDARRQPPVEGRPTLTLSMTAKLGEVVLDR